jgi:Na+/H+ antiporter NhaD/arsenite permease-like protein
VILSHPEVRVFRNLVDHPAVLLVPVLMGLIVLAVVVFAVYRVVRAGVRDGIRDAERERRARD